MLLTAEIKKGSLVLREGIADHDLKKYHVAICKERPHLVV
jgi:hypothetical protein